MPYFASMNIQQNIDLTTLNTFGIRVVARYFIEITTLADVPLAFDYAHINALKVCILGGGSNMLFTNNLDALVLHINIKGIELKQEYEKKVIVTMQAGENWHNAVLWAIDNQLGGIENLSLIPGTCGAAPIQNIGAYGVELADVLHEVHYYCITSKSVKTLAAKDCRMGYRDSIFKQELKNKYIILSIDLLLTKVSFHQFKLNYGDVQSMLHQQKITHPTIKNISDVIIKIRQSKLPDPNVLGNAGSFFKNTFISKAKLDILLMLHPSMPFYATELVDVYKLPTAWLVEQCGLKGYQIGNAGVHVKQALVLVNYGGATGNEVWRLAQYIIKCVQERFDIAILPEVNIV